MDRSPLKDTIVAAVAASDKPMTAQEIIEATGLGSSGVYMLVYELRIEGRLTQRPRPNPGRGRDLKEYFVGPAARAEVCSKDFDDEVPDSVWWREQAARGFHRPGRMPKQLNVKHV